MNAIKRRPRLSSWFEPTNLFRYRSPFVGYHTENGKALSRIDKRECVVLPPMSLRRAPFVMDFRKAPQQQISQNAVIRRRAGTQRKLANVRPLASRNCRSLRGADPHRCKPETIKALGFAAYYR